MLEKVNLKKTMIKEEYKPEVRPLKERLTVLQQTLKEKKLPVIILFDGWGASGKGRIISQLIMNLDPRNFTVYTNPPATPEDRRRHFLWRYWNELPAKGEISVLDRSWYQECSVAAVEEGLSGREVASRIDSINIFERQLCDDGMLVIKFFLHIGKKEQKKRLEDLESSSITSWRVTPLDWKRNKHYDQYYKAFDRGLEQTNTSWAPWHVVGVHDFNDAMATIYHVVVESIEEKLAQMEQRQPVTQWPEDLSGGFQLVDTPKLEEIRLNKSVEPDRYKELLEKQQAKLSQLHNKIYRSRVPVIVVYEGWDAAGKGGNIKRVSAALDPRGYEVIPIAAPSKEELNHHYLWRFWKQLPKDGHVAIFDRSWYGRVMVERLEGFCTPEEWHRAYREMNEFEKELYDWGAVIVKFWLQIDQDEQLKRFTLRQNTPEKQWKITEEDWRNREKWPQYEEAVNDMLRYTSTDFAPWTIIESNDKKFARIKAISTLISAIEDRL